jgi:hypothetical protein
LDLIDPYALDLFDLLGEQIQQFLADGTRKKVYATHTLDFFVDSDFFV